VAYVNALGYYELYINGKKVDDHVLSPHVSDYSSAPFYVAHEIAAISFPARTWPRSGWAVAGTCEAIRRDPRRAAGAGADRDGQGDGSRSEVVTDESWKLARAVEPGGLGARVR